jgi:uncharacterized protein
VDAVFILPTSIAIFLVGIQLMQAGLLEQREQALQGRMMDIGLGAPRSLLICQSAAWR